MRLHELIHVIRNVILRYERHGLSPFKCGAFALIEERGLAPRIERVETLFRFTLSPSVLSVHVETGSAAIDLGSARLDQMQKGRSQTGAVQITFDRKQKLHDLGIGVPKFYSGYHGELLPLLHLDVISLDDTRGMAVTG